jgi:hypothetical protein
VSYQFLRYARLGAASAIATPEGGTNDARARFRVGVGATRNGAALVASGVDIALYGPSGLTRSLGAHG